MKSYIVFIRDKTFPVYRDLACWPTRSRSTGKFLSHMNTTFPLSGKTFCLHFTKSCHSGKLYPISRITFLHMNKTKLFDSSKCFLTNRDNFCMPIWTGPKLSSFASLQQFRVMRDYPIQNAWQKKLLLTFEQERWFNMRNVTHKKAFKFVLTKRKYFIINNYFWPKNGKATPIVKLATAPKFQQTQLLLSSILRWVFVRNCCKQSGIVYKGYLIM